MADLLTMQDLSDGHLDTVSFGEAVNGDENTQVVTRTGMTYPSLKKAVKTMFENGGLPATPFATKALMTASTLFDGDYAMVTDDTVNNGLYVKTAGVWIKSVYDPLTQAKADATTKAALALSSAKAYTDDAQTNIAIPVIETTKSAINEAVAEAVRTSGYIILDSFELGATITQRNQALRHTTDSKLYRWSGNLPKAVPVSSTPTSTGGFGVNAWLEVSDTVLRQELSSGVGAEKIGYEDTTVAKSLQKAMVNPSIGKPKFPLDIPTFDGDPNATHPSVVYTPEGWHGYAYWMAFTPFPDDFREFTEIVASHDGVNWEVPKGGKAPIFNQQEMKAALGNNFLYNSDPDLLLLNDGRMVVYMRPVSSTNGVFGGPYGEWLVRSFSNDGINWSPLEICATTAIGSEIKYRSPTLVQESDGSFKMWATKGSPAGKLTLYTSIDGLSWSAGTECVSPLGRGVWHVDVNKTDDGLYHLLAHASQTSSFLYYWVSSDGITWQGGCDTDGGTNAIPLIEGVDKTGRYKSTFQAVAGDPYSFHIWMTTVESGVGHRIAAFLPNYKLGGYKNVNLMDTAYQQYSKKLVGYSSKTDLATVFLGLDAGKGNTGAQQTAVGELAGYLNTALQQLAIGSRAGYLNTGNYQTAVGRRAGELNNSENQVAVGFEAGFTNKGATQTAYGYQAGYLNTGIKQTALGERAGHTNTGSNQTAIGSRAGWKNSAISQTAIGMSAGENNIGVNQTAVGSSAGMGNTGSNQTALGSSAGLNNTGFRQVAIGSDAGKNNTANNTVSLGDLSLANHLSSVALGYATQTTKADQLAVGDRDIELQGNGRGVFLKSPNGTRYKITVDNAGLLTAVAAT